MQVRTLVCSLAAVLLLFVCTAFASEQTVALRAEPRSPVRSEAEATKKLISQLGSDDFTKRRAAEVRLIELGAAAFDDLLDAQTDPDLEIATQSQYLLHRVPIDWARPTDAAAVRELMTNYAKVNSGERREIIAQLAALDDAAGLGALSRVAHYELTSAIAKEAVLTVLNDHRQHQKSADEYSTRILEEIGTSPRDSAQWLR
jgi:hypothetical protein